MKYDPVNKPFQSLVHDPNNPNTLSKGDVFGILASNAKPGVVYVGTRGGGVNVYDPTKQKIDKITFKVVDDMFGGSARSIAEDADGALWLGTWGDGVVQLDKNNKEIRRYKYDSLNKNSLSHNQVRVIKPDKKSQLWIGTNNGLSIINTKTNTVQRVIERVPDNQNLSVPIEIKTSGNYWVMTVAEQDPLILVDLGWIENEAKDTVWRMGGYEQTLHAGGAYKNRIEIGTVALQPGRYTLRFRTDDSHAYGKWNEPAPDQTSLYGIALLKPQQGGELQAFATQIKPEEKEEFAISGSNVNDIEVTDKYIWVATEGNGIDRIDPVTSHVKSYLLNPDDANSLSNNNIRDIHADSRGTIWFATNEGITKLDPATETFTRYSEADGLPTNLTEGIVEGDNGEMWIATQNGLSQMVINERLGKATFINYNSTDGLTGDAFLSLANTRATDGRFYFGSVQGLTTFSSITANNLPPAIIISNFFISNKSVLEMQENSPLTESLLETKSVSLPFNQNSLSFEFAALHYANPKKNQYAHMLEGYDQDWIYDNRNFAAYTNLDPGNYKFKVRASNAYGIWNEEGLTFEITILPPWWRTWWAYASYIILFAGFAFTADRTVRRSIKLRERERSRERELKQAKEIEKAYTELKATQSQLIQSEKMASLGELTAGIAHEIQNPLNFVNNFAEINKELVDELKQEIEAGNLSEAKAIASTLADNESKVMFHGKRADGIVKGMLQHSRVSSGQNEPTDINALCDEYLRLSYHGLRAKDKSFNASFKTNFDSTIAKVNIIPQDIGRVILNLLTNAFYAVNEKKKKLGSTMPYAPTVTVTTKSVGGKIVIQVEDNGNGIPQSITQKIFQPFFTTKPAGQGTGLGLSMSYDIVTNGHGGNLTVESQEGEGSTFILVLPL
jgi:signal transduction histidine kinase/streptogramin lyase